MWTGRPPCEEWASLLSTWIRPASASSACRRRCARAGRSRPSPGPARRRRSSAAIRSYMSAERWRSGWAISAAVAALGQVLDRGDQAVAQRPRRRLEQHPAAARRAPPGPAPPRSRPSTAVSATSPPCSDRRPARPRRASAALSASTRPASCSIRTSWSWRMCGVAQIASMPSLTAWRAMPGCRRDRARRRRAPGRMWQCRSITRDSRRVVGARRGPRRCKRSFRHGRAQGMGLR